MREKGGELWRERKGCGLIEEEKCDSRWKSSVVLLWEKKR